ncbi:MAG: ABC transporter ATP-binding protein [bacterium]|nr:ABC transporter ATP-binding protein [bacterium]
MDISAENITKRFENEWIVKDFSHNFENGSKTAIIGQNGSGKSTLLKIIAGIMLPNKGKIEYRVDKKVISAEEVYKKISFCSPAQELIEEFTLEEILKFHFKFRKPILNYNVQDIIELTYFKGNKNKLVKNFSSGMKQRLKLGLALFTESSVILLDEPTTNMDETGISWYQETILKLLNDRSVIISSNQNQEYEFCESHISMQDFKPRQKTVDS